MPKPRKSQQPVPQGGEIILYQTEDGQTRIQCRFEDKAIWLTQKLMGELFQKDIRTIDEHNGPMQGFGFSLGRRALLSLLVEARRVSVDYLCANNMRV